MTESLAELFRWRTIVELIAWGAIIGEVIVFCP